ncbi:hypothetical protein VKT23_015383 [Stygiomarasmius scandens]|uniref:YMC020W-like alpha/beta hydrolase domain-containing protein n=1 Tax=Marasmiellus scandens TaxID=2682957 RepID=A0ABR1IXQ0_9AGAR
MVTNSDEATQDPVSVVASASQATTTMEPTSTATYTGSWWDYVGWGNSTATATTATGASSSSAGAAEGAKEPSSSDQAEAQAPSSSTESSVETNTSIAASESTMAPAQAVPPQTAPPPSQLVQPDPDSSSLPSATEPEIEIKSAPPTVPDTKPPRAASVFSGETVRSGAASWLAPWTWYSGSTPVSGSAGPSSVVAASSSATSVDRGSRLKRQMTESEKVKEEALARDREREMESKAESEAEKGAHQSQSTGATETKAGSSEQGQQQRVEQPLPSDSQSGNNAGSAPGESGVEALAGSGSSVPAATTADEPATANAVTTLATTSPSRNDAGSGSGSGWTSFFSLTGKGKSPADKHVDDGKGANVNGNENEGVDDEVRRDENGMEVMDLDSDEEGFGGQTQTPAGTGTGTDAQPGVGVNEASKDVATIDDARGKELVKKEKETMREILKAGATSPERKVSLVKALLLQPSSPRPASILSSSSPVKAISPPPESPTKAASTRSAGPSTNGKDQTEFKARGRTDSILTTATTTSNASEMAKRAPLLVVSDDIKAKAAAKAAKSAAKEKEKEREKEKEKGMAATAGPEVLDGKKAVEKKSSKDPVKEKEKKKEKEEKRSKSKSGSGSSTPAPPSAPPNLVLPTWSDTFYTAPRSHLPSGVLPTNPLPGTEAYEAMVQMQGKNIEQKGLGTFGKTMKYVSGVLFSGDRGSGGSSTSGNGERKTSSLFGGSTAPGSSAGARFSDALAGRRGSSGSTSSIPVNTEGKSGPISPRIAALRAGSSSGRGKGGSVKMGSTELEKLKEKEAEIEAERRREKEKLYWDWGRGLPRAWEVVEYGQPVGLMESEMKDEEDAKEKLEKEQDKSPPPQNAKEALSSQTAMPGMGLEPATTLSLPADMLTAYKGKGKYKANTEVSEAVQDVLKGCKKVVVIGIHGWFPGAVIKSVLGEPTGTSTKFVNMMVQALEDFQDRHEVRLDKVTKIPLEGEGTIDRRVEKLYTNLLSNQEWMDDLHAADAIFVATHSQGSVVSTHLLDRLIRERHIRTRKNGTTEAVTEIGVNMIPLPPQRVCCLALCGIHLGPLRYLSTSSLLQPYIQYFESAAARELFEFQNTENDVSKAYVRALRNVVDNGTKMVYVASLNDQVVPIYSGLFTSVSHPLILRALYIDGDAYHSSDFLSNLLVLLLRVLNCGLSDSGLLAHLSEVTAGSLNGVGHSTAYEELATFSLAVNYLFLTNDGFEEHPELTLEPFNASAEMNDYEIPWALRDLIADERVAHFFSQEITNLRDAFRDWNPKTSILRDIKRKLQPIQRLPSTIAPGSANSTSKL